MTRHAWLSLALLVLSGCTAPEAEFPEDSGSQAGGDPPQSSTDPTGPADGTQKAASQLVLTLQDFPAGWMGGQPKASDRDVPNTRDNASNDVYRGAGSPAMVVTHAFIFNDSAAADSFFEAKRAEVEQQYSTDTVGAGDEAFLWKVLANGQEQAYARRADVVWELLVLGDGTGSPFSPTSSALLKQVANKF